MAQVEAEDLHIRFFEGEKTGAPVGELEVGEAPAKRPLLLFLLLHCVTLYCGTSGPFDLGGK